MCCQNPKYQRLISIIFTLTTIVLWTVWPGRPRGSSEKDTCFFIHLDSCQITFQPDDLPHQLTVSHSYQLVHGSTCHVAGRDHCKRRAHRWVFSLQLREFAHHQLVRTAQHEPGIHPYQTHILDFTKGWHNSRYFYFQSRKNKFSISFHSVLYAE